MCLPKRRERGWEKGASTAEKGGERKGDLHRMFTPSSSSALPFPFRLVGSIKVYLGLPFPLQFYLFFPQPKENGRRAEEARSSLTR